MGAFFRGNPKGCWSSFRAIEVPCLMVWWAALPCLPHWDFSRRLMGFLHHHFSYPRCCGEQRGVSRAIGLFSSCTGCSNLCFFSALYRINMFKFPRKYCYFKILFPMGFKLFFNQLCKGHASVLGHRTVIPKPLGVGCTLSHWEVAT